ncbi:uncharacterized protein METZ01_LOCUS416416, partial [marine metagenome]
MYNRLTDESMGTHTITRGRKGYPCDCRCRWATRLRMRKCSTFGGRIWTRSQSSSSNQTIFTLRALSLARVDYLVCNPLLMAEEDLTLVDLFSGCGGLSLGLHQAGFRTVLANELHRDPADTYIHNLIP